ncbi:hypothetical protein V1634_27460 [Plantactinospora veratri]|uniref:Uncharacterized protein n=1 Tax=Plantactinospora veratri TaxID=1436122 RepID=A0ABU7SFR8_9ACTN
MSDDSGSDSNLQALLAEFAALRQEILDLSAQRHNLLIYQITTAGALFGFALSGANRTTLLLILPVSTYLLYSRYVLMRRDIARLGRYIETELSPRAPGGLNWEEFNRLRSRRSSVGLLQPTFIAFPGISALALTAATPAIFEELVESSKAQGVGLLIVWSVGLVLTSFIAYQVWENSVRPFLLRRDSERRDYGR